MTPGAPSPAHARLPAIDPDRATLQSALVEALNRRRVDALLLSAGVADDASADAWIALAAAGATLHVAPLLADGAVPPLLDAGGRPDAALAAAALGTVEPVIAAIERVTGRSLRPTELVAAPAGDAVILRIEARADGAPVHRLLLRVADEAGLAPVGDLPLDRTGLGDVAPRWTARIAGPAVPLASLVRLRRLDLLLLGTPLGPARLIPPGRDTVLAGRLDVEGGMIMVEHDLGQAGTAVAERDDRPGDDHPGPGISIGTVIEIDLGGLTPDRLAALGVGSVIAVPDAGGGVLPARLIAGGRPVARGELVAVGDGYGLLITAVVADGADRG